MKITVIRAFLIGGIRQEVGAMLDLPEPLARELLALNKAAPAVEVPDTAPAIDPAETAPAKRNRTHAKETK